VITDTRSAEICYTAGDSGSYSVFLRALAIGSVTSVKYTC